MSVYHYNPMKLWIFPNEMLHSKSSAADWKHIKLEMTVNDQVEDNTCLLEDIDKLHNAKNSSFTREYFRVHNRESRIQMLNRLQYSPEQLCTS